MSQEQCVENFEQQLLDHVEMLYAVALKLTANSWDAERITRTTMQQAWQWRDSWDGQRHLKAELLKLLRQTVSEECRADGLRTALRAFQIRPLTFAGKAGARVPRQERMGGLLLVAP